MTTTHATGTREEWLTARLALLDAEKELTRRSDELARQRRELPWVRIEKDYRFDTDDGGASLKELFRGRSQLIVYHFMYDPSWSEGCPSCSAVTDGFAGSVVHLDNHDVAMTAVSRAPLAQLQAYKQRMGWDFPWASSFGSDFNYDFHVTLDPSVAPVEWNFRGPDELREHGGEWMLDGQSWEQPGVSAFALQDGDVYHTYSAYSRGFDALWSMFQWLDRAPLGRNEDDDPNWFRRHDQYDRQ